MASVYTRNGTYIARFYDSKGNRHTRSTKCKKKKEALRLAALMEAEYRRQEKQPEDKSLLYETVVSAAGREAEMGELTLERAEHYLRKLREIANPDFRDINVESWFQEWLENKKRQVKASTMACYIDTKQHILQALGPKKSSAPLEALTRQDIRDAQNKIAKKVSPMAANYDLNLFRRVLEGAVEEKLIPANVAKSVKPMPEPNRPSREPFTKEEVQKLIQASTSDEWRGMILIAAHTGLRMGDIIMLSRENVDGTNLVCMPEKTNKHKKVITVPMSPPVIAWIKGRRGKFFKSFIGKATSTHSTTFRNIMNRAKVPREVKLPGGLTGRRSFHSLRHTFASWLAEADIHSDVRQKLTGHSSSGIHARYIHHDESLSRAIQTLPDLDASQSV